METVSVNLKFHKTSTVLFKSIFFSFCQSFWTEVNEKRNPVIAECLFPKFQSVFYFPTYELYRRLRLSSLSLTTLHLTSLVCVTYMRKNVKFNVHKGKY